jgi:hypothetical protein
MDIMENTEKRICKFYVTIAPNVFKFFTEEEYELAVKCAEEHNTHIKLV